MENKIYSKTKFDMNRISSSLLYFTKRLLVGRKLITEVKILDRWQREYKKKKFKKIMKYIK